jgi:uncharacterized membrane protein
MESPIFSALITRQITSQYQQGEGLLTVMAQIREMIAAFIWTSNYRKEIMLITFLAGLLKLLSNPALLAALIAFLQKSLHP